MKSIKDRYQKRVKLLPEMEGAVARWYDRNRRSGPQMEVVRRQAAQLTEGLLSDADVLEVAPGPGYLAIDMARRGRFHVTGLDISRTFVEIANENAAQADVRVDFRQGDVASIPFPADSFDLVVCQAAFKNFAQPGRALDELHRVLRGGGTPVIQDMSRDASGADIAHEVSGMGLSRLNAFVTKAALTGLRRRAYTPAQLERLAAESAFQSCAITTEGIGLEVRLKKPITA